MRKLNVLLAGAVAAAAVLVAPAANAAVAVQVLGAGSSAIFNTASLGAYNLAGAGALHYTTKGTCSDGSNCAQIIDSRTAGIVPQGGNLSVVWNSAQTAVWAYLSVDSVVGNRAFFAVPRTTLQLDAENETPGNPQNLIASTLWGADQQELPPAIYAALNGTMLTAAFTDIRPEDAEFASTRTLAALGSGPYGFKPLEGLGYGPSPIGTPILSDFTGSSADPVAFNITGTDPITGETVPPFQTVSIGATPIILVVNKTNASGLGTPGLTYNTTPKQIGYVWEGKSCIGSTLITGAPAVPLTVILREPMSGTMNTFEQTLIANSKNPADSTQEFGINPAAANSNPLNLMCGTTNAGPGIRKRAIGTGEVVSNGVLPEADSVGYLFFGYGNVSKIAGSTSYGYLTLGGVDPIFSSYTNGELPTCANPCPVANGTSFPNLRDGHYSSWSVLRAVANPNETTNFTNLTKLVNHIQNIVDSTVPDFVPFNAQGGGEPGLRLYRSHYFQSGIAPNNGLTVPADEAGGDMGGCIEAKTTGTGVLGCHD